MADTDTIAKVAPPGAPKPDGTPYGGGYASIQGDPNAKAFGEIGVSGLKVFSGYLNEEYQQELRGAQAIKVYRQMSETDPVVNAVLTAIVLILRAVDWRVEPANDTPQAEKEAEFARSLLDDMSHSWEDTVSEIMSMLSFGWSYHEMVLKRRVGPDQKDGSTRSKFTDGRIGIRKLPIRSQDSMMRWEMQPDGGIDGLWQMPPQGGQLLYIPIERALLFRTTSVKNSPEGKSILRAAYRPWYIKKTVEDMEAIGIERELGGLPLVSIPAKYLRADASDADKAIKAQYDKIARDVKFNQQGGIVIPSDRWPDQLGNPSAAPMVEVKLLSTGGRRAIDTDPVIARYNRNIAMSALADFITLGDQKGSYALSKNKSELFLRACETYLNQIAAAVNRFMLPRIWAYNGISYDLMPEMKPGRVAPVDLAELGTYVQQLAAAGAPLFPNDELSEHLADVAGLPEPPEQTALNIQMPGQTGAATADDTGADLAEADAGGDTTDLSAEGFMDNTRLSKRGGHGKASFPFGKAFNPSEARDEHGRWTSDGGAGLKAQGLAAADAKKAEWAAQSPYTSADAIMGRAGENQKDLGATGDAIAKDTGATFVNPGPKSLGRLVEKHVLAKINRGKAPATITDAVRGGFLVESPAQADNVVAGLAKRYQVADEGWQVTRDGYFDRKAIVRFPDGMSGEVQMWHPDLLAAKEGGGGHAMYVEAQSLPNDSPRQQELRSQMRSLYGKAAQGLPSSWNAVAGSGGN